MTAIETAEQFRQRAIQTLLDEKTAIEEMLKTLGFQNGPTSQKKRGRPRANPAPQEPLEISQGIAIDPKAS